jgi:hypothetical protein
MPHRTTLIAAVLLLPCLVAAGKDKKKGILPQDILEAHTAWVIVDPDAGVDIQDPNANNNARRNVENALVKWGRLSPVTDPNMADIIIVVRKGNDKIVQPTIGGTPVNGPPPMIGQQTDGGINASGRQGGPPYAGQSEPRPQLEVADTQDSFLVYRANRTYNGSVGNPLDTPAVWRFNGMNALSAPSVPAVEAFHDAIAKSEKALAKP